MRDLLGVVALAFYLWVMYAVFVTGCRVMVWAATLPVLPW
jgi:hypothetical protein